MFSLVYCAKTCNTEISVPQIISFRGSIKYFCYVSVHKSVFFYFLLPDLFNAMLLSSFQPIRINKSCFLVDQKCHRVKKSSRLSQSTFCYFATNLIIVVILMIMVLILITRMIMMIKVMIKTVITTTIITIITTIIVIVVAEIYNSDSEIAQVWIMEAMAVSVVIGDLGSRRWTLRSSPVKFLERSTSRKSIK